MTAIEETLRWVRGKRALANNVVLGGQGKLAGAPADLGERKDALERLQLEPWDAKLPVQQGAPVG